MALEFKKKYSMQNGNKVVAISSQPCKHVLCKPDIETAKALHGNYFEKWKLVFEEADPQIKDEVSGYIFREVNHNGGINGKHKTPKQAIWSALGHSHIKVLLQD